MNKGLVSLSVGTFALGMTEFMMMGILVSLAGSLGVSVAQAGHLISAYAMGVCVGAACIQIAYNAGNAITAAIGSAAIASGMSYSSTAILGVPFFAVGSVLLYVLYFRFKRKSGRK